MTLTRFLGPLTACVLSVISGSTQAAVLQDNFNDNAIGNLWILYNTNTTKVRETQQRLCFRSTSDDTGVRRAGYFSNAWTYRGHRTATISFDFKVNVPGLTGNESAAVGVFTDEPSAASGLEVRIVQNANGRFVELELFVDSVSVLSEQAPINVAAGSVEIRYVQSTDIMRVKVNGDEKITVPELNGNYGPFDLTVELFGESNRTSFAYNQVWIDNFRLSGVIDD
jgi:hypothetical protein